ncbi:efflux RND transporter permease subunit [Bradyrhizobium canariense]|uniref:Hydrophobic/amphiphilic exporter-1, HAE1 family n=1 Tax=Bradyrhizobium canariense TaxID=255045 RepID=A0A1H1WUQ3_9BRAD|nr:efflux RND transporter permease subunit [Bradyrhizobium canariense]SDT00401.1 hydrophobic/amphiphilic exporter-1, HAE1 family [Bradyrhizobium canariense]
MNFSAPFIHRPIATALLMVAIVLLGIIGYELLPVAALPEVDSPTIQVTAQLPGADPQTMASSVATPLERQFGQIPGLAQMSSSSALGYTQITLQFSRDRTIDSAAQDVQAAINATSGQLPPNLLNPPIYRKTNPADTPILLLALTSDTLPLTKVSDYANSILVQKLSQMPGVGLVSLGGEQNPAIRVQVNPAQLAAAGLDLESVRTALANSTVNQPKGTLYGGQHAFSLLTNDQLTTASGFDDYILAYRNGAPIRVRDVGRAIVAPEDKTLAGWLGTQRAVLIAIQRQPGANVIATVDQIKKALPQLEASLPPSIKVEIVSDRTQTIRASVADIQFTLMLTIALVVAVIFLFLRKLWATVIPAIAVPLSLVGTFAVMYALGFSLDNLSLMALTIAVGFVVDDAVVMIENIVRHVEGGSTPMTAAIAGAGEIGFTILSISISLVAVFIPLFLMSGVVGLLFREFAVTVAVSIAVSLIVSLTLTPMMCARLLAPEGDHSPGRTSQALERFFDRLVATYDRALVVALRHRLVTLMVMIFTVVLTLALFVVIPKGFFPQQDTGMIVGISEGAQDISPQAMMDRQEAVLGVVVKDPAVASATAYIGPGGSTVTENDGRMFITLKPHSERSATADQVITRLNRALQPIQGITLYMQAAQDINVGARLSKTQYQYTLVDVDSAELNHWAPVLLEKMQGLPQLRDVASDQQSAGRTLNIEVNREAASRLGVDPAQVDGILYDAFGQRHVARIYTTLNQYYVIIEVDPSFQLGPNALSRIYAKSASGSMVPLNQLASVTPAVAPLAVNHQGQFPSVTLSFNLAANSTIGDAVTAIRHAAADLHLPTSIATSFQGNAQAFQSSLSSTPILILAALVAVYIILGMLYESTIHPLTIISTLPSAGLGALLTLMLFGMPLDVIGIIGIILLIGIVKKNGIMLIDFALEAQRERGLSSEDAIHEACRLRFRPILMTTLCALLAGIPLMVGTGTGSEIRQPLGYAIVGGLLVSQVLTLFTTPIVYIYMDRLSGWLSRRSRPQSSARAGTSKPQPRS